MSIQKKMEWALRIGVAGEFLGHGMLAVQGKKDWIQWMVDLVKVSDSTAASLVFAIGVLDILVAIIVLVRPIKPVLLWAAFWGFATALVRPFVGASFWDFIERFANWGAPLALYYLLKSENR